VDIQTFADSPSLCEEQSKRYWDYQVTVLRQVYLNMKHANKNVLIRKALIFNIFSKSVHLVDKKLNETKGSFLEVAVLTGQFYVEQSV
jgi:hypothetical protein